MRRPKGNGKERKIDASILRKRGSFRPWGRTEEDE